MYLYRDTSEPPDSPATTAPEQGPDERDASYWYDLSGGDSAPAPAQTRGPFEPLVSSGGPPPSTPPPTTEEPSVPGSAGPNGQEPAGGGDGQEDLFRVRTSKLEQIKDFHLTGEAIGEQNVDKPFDQLLAQQRELISEYFKQSQTAGPGDPLGPGDPGGAGDPGVTGGRADAPYGAGVAAEHPHVW